VYEISAGSVYCQTVDIIIETVSPLNDRPNRLARLFGYLLLFVVGALLLRMSTVDAHTVAMKPLHGKITDSILDKQWRCAVCSSVKCRTGMGRCGVLGSTLAFGYIGHGLESEHRLFSH